MKFVTVFSALNSAEAQLARARLEAADFHAVVMRESSVLTPAMLTKGGAIEVQVPEDEAEDAKALLAAGAEPPAADQS